MTKKIKLSLFTLLFRFFAFLADKTNGWRMFVQPKLLFGTLIIGLGMTACQQSGNKKENTKRAIDSVEFQTNTDSIYKQNDNVDSLLSASTQKTTDNNIATPPPPPMLPSRYVYLDSVTETADTVAKHTDSLSFFQEEKEEVVEEMCYVIVEHYPEYPGGSSSMMKYISQNIKLPELPKEQLGGKVVCEFVVEADGSVSNVKIIKSLHPIIDAEVLRVVRSMPKWLPGKQRGKAVPATFTLPIQIDLQ